MSTKKVSIIIPVYNATKSQLEASINSVINQTYGNIELILINDKSFKEETIDQLTVYSELNIISSEKGYQRVIKFYNNDEKIGISSSRNKGIEESTGDYICFLDQDDYYDPNYVIKLVEAITLKEADIAMCGFYSIDENGNIIDTFPKGDMDTESAWYPWSICSIWNRIYRRDFIQQYNIHFPDGCVTEDIVFLMQCNFFAAKIAVVKEALYRNVIRQSSTSHSKDFHALKLNQMPFDQISHLLKAITNNTTSATLLRSSQYLKALICDEMALLCYILSTGSDNATAKEAVKKAGLIIRLSTNRGSLKYIHQFNKYCKDKKSMQVLILLIYCSSKLHIEVPIAMLIRKIIKRSLQ
ncbi:glycosyltransferase family 2 protein [Butyrivibrio sp. TB]|uniref:glycosyltransferase family 2 protein n=1 Tax=Butyrivibrio sp. TB TaxID=1520809 RepID=UPI0008CA3B67|nr:glycosyltransferase [Butyrivibrio sp. TB]SEP95085.1 Glycosyl transferase family 2 [Butyrivibrio sp. TB]